MGRPNKCTMLTTVKVFSFFWLSWLLLVNITLIPNKIIYYCRFMPWVISCLIHRFCLQLQRFIFVNAIFPLSDSTFSNVYCMLNDRRVMKFVLMLVIMFWTMYHMSHYPFLPSCVVMTMTRMDALY